jgi:hypothetical protein
MPYNQIRTIVTLFENIGFKGRHCTLVDDTPDLKIYDFRKKASSIMIHRGPNYNSALPAKVSFHSGVNYELPQLILEPGRYSDLRYPLSFNDRIVSVSFTLGQFPASPDPISSIQVVGELYVDKDYKGRKLIVVQDIADLHAWAAFGDNVTSVKVFAGPNYAPGSKLRLYRNKNYLGGEIALDPGDYPNLNASHAFNDVVSSVKVNSAGAPIL